MKFDREIKIGNIEISDKSKVFIIAEAGVNHNGDIEVAKKLIDIASEAGADAVKFQAFRTENLILKNVSKASYQKETTSNKESQFDMLKKLEISINQNKELKEYCEQKGIIFLTTPFDEGSLVELDEIDLPAYKIASTDLTNILFLKKVAQRNKPILLSIGMSYLEEVTRALEQIYKINKKVILLHCTANYPIVDEDANLNVIDTLKNKFDILVGYSDHSVGIGAAPYAVPKGVKVIEKHFTISNGDEGPDHRASLTPEQLKYFVTEIRKVEKYLGTEIKMPTLAEIKNRASLQKCLVASKPIRVGEEFTEDNLIAKRTGGVGVSPIYIDDIVGNKSRKNYEIDDIIEV